MKSAVRRFGAWAGPSLLVTAMLTVLAPVGPAWAACHAFTVSVSPSEVEAGGTVLVTVRRDAAVAPSSIDVSTVDGTATADQDYVALSETADFPDGGTAQEFTIEILEGAAGTFLVHLENPQGCPANTNYQVGDDAEVTIVGAGEATDDPEPTETEATAPPTVEDQPTPETVDEDDDGVPTGVIFGLAILAALVVGGVLYALSRRSGA